MLELEVWTLGSWDSTRFCFQVLPSPSGSVVAFGSLDNDEISSTKATLPFLVLGARAAFAASNSGGELAWVLFLGDIMGLVFVA